MHHKNLSNGSQFPAASGCQDMSGLRDVVNRGCRGVIGLLVDEVNPLVSVMKVDKARDGRMAA